MPFDLVRWIVQFLHVLSGVLWIGGGFYAVFVQLPALLATAPAARGPALAELGPRQIRYLLRVAELTIATGIVNAVLSGRLAYLGETLQSLWGWAIGLGFVLAVGLYVFIQAVIKPLLLRVLALGRAAAGGDASAAADMPALIGRFRSLGYAQLGVGALIVLLMVTASFS